MLGDILNQAANKNGESSIKKASAIDHDRENATNYDDRPY
jgi:hypothetical protein